MNDPITGSTIRWTFDDGPVAGKTFEHVFEADGGVSYRVVDKTNANVMLVPGFIATFTTRFDKAGERLMPCHEYCGTGHEAMWGRVQVLPAEEFLAKAKGGERMSCVPH